MLHCVAGLNANWVLKTETKSSGCHVLKDSLILRMILGDRMLVYPGVLHGQTISILICKGNTSISTTKTKQVMTHGGITLARSVVPFVRIRRKDNG
jgi:hypothetical protein